MFQRDRGTLPKQNFDVVRCAKFWGIVNSQNFSALLRKQDDYYLYTNFQSIQAPRAI